MIRNISRLFAAKDDKLLLVALKSILGFNPKNIAIYKQALRHKSSAVGKSPKQKTHNERLEYLGDAVLSAVVADILFKKFPFKDEGFLTEMRSKIVSREQLNRLSQKMGIFQLVETGDDQNQRNKSMGGDALEAIIGAIYLDRGYSLTKDFILKRIIQVHVDIDTLENVENNHKSRLIEWAQRERKNVHFEVLEEIGNKNSKQLKVQVSIDGVAMGMGIDFSKKKAEQIAAEAALKNIGSS